MAPHTGAWINEARCGFAMNYSKHDFSVRVLVLVRVRVSVSVCVCAVCSSMKVTLFQVWGKVANENIISLALFAY